MFLYSKWRELPLTTRALLAAQFGFSKAGPTHVSDNRIVDDGYKIEDVERCLNLDAIEKYTGVEQTDMATLWDLMVAKIEGRVSEPVPEVIVEEVIVVEEVKPEPKKRGRKSKTK